MKQRRTVAGLDDLQAKVDAARALQSTAAQLDTLLPPVLNQAFKGKET